MKSKFWLIIYLSLTSAILLCIAGLTIYLDPYMHYHKPLTDKYYYVLDNQRSMNNGIMRHFDYDAIITGTSMTECFKASELDALFRTNSIKVCFSGATYKEINDNLSIALKKNSEVKMVVRALDLSMLSNRSDAMRTELGWFPTYLYDDNYFNDVEYLFNRDVLIKNVYFMLLKKAINIPAGITSFDEYSNWEHNYKYGSRANNLGNAETLSLVGSAVYLTEQERSTTLDNIKVNVTALARQYPDVEFYYFFSPYSVAWWQSKVADGTVYKYLEALKIASEEILSCDNIKLFSFFELTDVVDDLNNYKDSTHYGSWVNSVILKLMSEDRCRLTKENYMAHLDFIKDHYLNYNYVSLLDQDDYTDDSIAAQLVRRKYGLETLLPRS